MTTLQMALNAPPECTVYTLDLPAGQEPSVPSSELDRYVAQSFLPRFGTSTGSYFKGRTDVRIVQLLGDSTTFGYNAWIDGPIDLVFIDGAHDYRTKKIDSENALRLLSPTGVILWDNFADVCCPEVTRYLLDLSADLSVSHLKGTLLAVHRRGGERPAGCLSDERRSGRRSGPADSGSPRGSRRRQNCPTGSRRSGRGAGARSHCRSSSSGSRARRR